MVIHTAIQEALGRQRKQQILDGYYQASDMLAAAKEVVSFSLTFHGILRACEAKDLVGKSLASVSHQRQPHPKHVLCIAPNVLQGHGCQLSSLGPKALLLSFTRPADDCDHIF